MDTTKEDTMKPWDYYNLKGDYAFHLPFARRYLIRNRLIEKINNTPLTDVRRNELMRRVTRRAQNIAARANRSYYAEQAKRLAELEIDQREAIGYNDLPESVIETIESKAWEQSHAHGLKEVYYHIQDLVAFTRKIISQYEAATEGNP